MKKNFLYTLLIGSCLASLASCDVNDWNDKLDGFEGDPEISDKQSVEYTLTEADYANIAGNKANKDLAGKELANDLKAVGTNHYFTEKILAKDYIPNYLGDSKFPYFTLSDGSAVKVTYQVATEQPAEIAAVAGAEQYKLTEDDYMNVWGDEEQFAEALTPEKNPATVIPGALESTYPDAVKDDMVIVNYNFSTEEPDFGGAQPEVPAFELTSVLGTAAVGNTVDVKGLVTAICNRGYILTDNSGSILVYYSEGFVPGDWKIGDQLTVNGTVGSYNKGLQLDGLTATVAKEGNQAYVYPAPRVLDGAAFDALTAQETDELAFYCKFISTASVTTNSQGGTYYNFLIDGAEKAKGSLYQGTDEQKAMFVDGKTYEISGYFSSISGGRYCNIVVTSAKETTAKSLMTAAAELPNVEKVNAIYEFDGSQWKENKKILVLQDADYQAMGQKYGNLSHPENYLPAFLKIAKPYAQPQDQVLIAYKYYFKKETTYRCDLYAFDGAQWALASKSVEESAQFVKNAGKWMYDPNVTITLPGQKGNAFSAQYYQECVNYVYETYDKPLGSTGIKEGKFYVSSYGNNEYYCGTSAHYNNVDLRAAKAKEQYAAGWEGKSDEEIVATMKARFESEVFPVALAKIHPDAAPVPGLEVIYTINFVAFDGAASDQTIRYKVTAPAKFEFMDCTWNEAK